MKNNGNIVKYLTNAVKLQKEQNYSEAREQLLLAMSFETSSDILAELYFQLGICYMKLKEFEPAEMYINKSGEILNLLGITDVSHISESLILVYKGAGLTQKLKELCINILSSDSFNTDARLTLLDIYSNENNYEEADRLINEALEYDGNNIAILRVCIIIEKNMKKYEAAIKHSKKFYALHGGYDLAVNAAVADIRSEIGPVTEAVRLYAQAYDIESDYKKYVLSNCILAVSLYDEIFSKERYLDIMNFRMEYTAKLEKKLDFKNELCFYKKLRIGYLSNEFRRHPVGYFIVPVLKQTRNTQSEFLCYNLVNPLKSDNVGEYIVKNAGTVTDLYDKSDDELEKFIITDNPDILLDLKSITTDNKLELYAKRLAPLQVSWIGFPISSGVSAIDYIITDRCADPYPEAQELYNEKLLYLKNTFLCHELGIGEGSKRLPYLENNYITFGCFNNYIKITDRMLMLWQKILTTVNGSKIIFKSISYLDEYVTGLLKERLLRIGFDMSNVVIEPGDVLENYIKRYDDIDIILDTYPFNGATTTFDALLLGTPVVTLVGELHHTRMGLDLLSHVGLSDLACYSDCEYVEKTVALANNRDKLAYLKRELGNITKKSKLADADAFRAEYEYAMRGIWIDYCIKKRKENNYAYQIQNKDLNSLRGELLNGADYIRKCVSEGEFSGDKRTLLLDEYIDVQNRFINEIRKCNLQDAGKNMEYTAMLERLSALIIKLKDMEDKQIIKVLESNTVILERLP